MATDITMPRLSDSMEEGTVLKWLVETGAEIKRGQEIAEIETDKANMTYEADVEGTLSEIVAGEGDTVAIGEVIARLGEGGEAPSSGEDEDSAGDETDEAKASGDEDDGADAASADEDDEGTDAASDGEPEESEQAEEEEAAPVAIKEDDSGNGASATESKPSSGSGDNGDGRVKASPVARRMASEMSVDLSSLEGSGPGGRIVKADVQAAADGGGAKAEGTDAPDTGSAESATEDKPEPPPSERGAAGDGGAKGETEVVELSRLQKTVARRMAESKATAPDFQLMMEVDMSRCVALRAQLKEVTEKPPSYNDMVIKAVALALREHPRVNGAYKDGSFELYSRVNVGVAVAAQDALVVPTIFDADKKSLGEIARDIRGLAVKVRDGKIAPPELSGGTFAVSNLGMFGVDDVTAVINPPQAGIIGVGAMKKTPVVDDDGRIVAHEVMKLRLSGDHRILYGADGAEFLGRVRELLEQPLQLAL